MSSVFGRSLLILSVTTRFSHTFCNSRTWPLVHRCQGQALYVHIHIQGQWLWLLGCRLLLLGRCRLLFNENLGVGHSIVVLALVALRVEVDTRSACRSPFGGGLKQHLDSLPKAELLRCLPDFLEGHQEDDQNRQQSNDPPHSVGPQRIYIVSVFGWFVFHPVEEEDELKI